MLSVSQAALLRFRAGGLTPLLCLFGATLACGPSAAEPAAAEPAAAKPAAADLAPLRQALSGGEIAREHSGALALITVTRERVELCTATLLLPNLVATARHCVAATSVDSVRCAQDPAAFAEPYATGSLWLSREGALRDSLASYGLLPVTGGGDELVPVAEVFVPETQRVCGGDLALLLLEEELQGGEAQPIEPRLDEPVQHGERYTAVGFGATPDPDQQGTRRSRAGLQVTCTPESCAGVAAVEPTEFRGGDGVCSGDSGGPALDGAGRVLGIASRSVDCTGSVYSALARWREFVREVAARAVGAGDYTEPEWLEEAPPEPEPILEQPLEPPPAELAAPSTSGSAPMQMAEAEVAEDVSPAVASGAGSGCGLRNPSRTTRWQPLALLLGLAVGCCALRRSSSALVLRKRGHRER